MRKELRGKRLRLTLQKSVVDLSDSSKQFTQQTALACLNIHGNELHYHSVRTAMVGYCIEGLSAGRQASKAYYGEVTAGPMRNVSRDSTDKHVFRPSVRINTQKDYRMAQK